MAEWRERGYVPDSDDEGSDEEERVDYFGKRNEEGQHGNSDAGLTRENAIDIAEPVTPLADASLPLTSSPLLDPKPASSDTSRSATDLQHPAAQDGSASQRLFEPSTAEKLEAQLASGLQTCRDVLKSRALTPVLSDLDSPLSSLPSSPEVIAPDAEARRGLANQSGNHSPFPVREAEQQAIPASTLHAALTGRSFRPRALMQLHPYTVEYAKYQNDWKARGLPPIRPVDPQLRRQDEMQGTTTFNSSQNVASSSRPSSPLTDAMTVDEDESHSAMRPISPLQLQQGVALDDDLPDLADILRGDARESSTVVARKRKARADQRNNTRPKKLRRFNPLTDEAQARATEREHGLIFDLPPSPPHSARVFPSSLTTSEDDQLDLNMATPRPLPTPVLSSDRQITKRNIVQVSSSSASETESGSGFSSSSGNEAGGDESQGLMQIRRKIKGVLPASWLRLDAQHQKQPAAHRQYTVSPEKTGLSKGLAKHVVMSGRSVHDEDGRLWPPDLSSDGDDTDPAPGGLDFSRPATNQQLRFQSAHSDDDLFLDGVILEDEVDPMVPAASRASRQGPRAGKKRQQRLDDGWIVEDQDTHQRNPKSGQPRRRSTSHRTYHNSGHKRRKIREKQQQLTVLDAPGFVVESNDDVPRFLKVAARFKGSGRGTATQDARQKYFQLSTADDTAEVNDGLRDWTTGTSSRRRSPKSRAKSLARLRQNSHASRNVQPRSGQAQGVNVHADSDAQIRKLKTSTNKTLTRLQHQAAPGSKSYNAVSATESGQHLSRSRHLGVFFSHVNRSGRGSLLNPTLARVGQLEAPRVSLQLPKKKIRRPHAVFKAVQNQPIMGESSPPSQPALPQRASHQRKRKVPHIMAANVDAPRQPPSATLSPSDHFQFNGNLADRSSHGDDTAGSYYRVWLRNMSSLPASTIIQDLRNLVSPRSAPFSRSPYVSERRFEQVLGRLKTRRNNLREGNINYTPLEPVTLIAKSVVDDFHEIELQTPANTIQHMRSEILSQITIECVFTSLTILQRELGDNSWFSNLPTTAQILPAVLDSLAGTLQAWTCFLGSARPSDKVVCTFVFSQLLVCAYQVADIATEANDNSLLQRALRGLEEAAYQAIYSALTTVGCRWTQNQSYEGDPCGPLPIEPPPNTTIAGFIEHCRSLLRTYHFSYVVDTIIIVYHLVQRQRLPGAKFDFEQILHRTCSADGLADQPLVQLGSVIAVVRLVCPLTRLDIAGEAVLDQGFSGWHLLSQVGESSLAVAHAIALRGEHSLGRYWVSEQSVFMTHCLAFITEWGWEDPDAFLKSMFAAYAKDNLADLDIWSKEKDSRRPFKDVVLSTKDQGDFKGFLWLVTTVLRNRSALLESSDPKTRQLAANKLSALVFALLPNNTLPFHRQVKIQEDDYCSLANHYDLYLTLYVNASTRARPGPRMFKDLVDFQTCPGKIRELTIEVWADITRHAVSCSDANGDTVQLVDWAYEMLDYLVQEFKASCICVATETSDAVCNLINLHEDVSYSITAMLREWKAVLNEYFGDTVETIFPGKALMVLATFVSSANTQLSDFERSSDGLIDVFRYNHFPQNAGTTFRGFAAHPGSLRFEPYVAAMELLEHLTVKIGPKQKELYEVASDLARAVLATLLSSRGGCFIHDGQTCEVFRDVLIAITYSWFQIASLSIGLTRSWEEYLVAPSRLSFPLLSESESSRQCKTLFMARMIQDNPMNFTMDRTTFYAAWIEGMMVPEHLMAFEHVLGTEIDRYDQTPALVSAVLGKFTLGDYTLPITLQRLKAERYEILRSLIAAIYFLQMNPPVDDESQLSVDGALNSYDLANLLKVMTDTIKHYWQAGLVLGEQQSTYQVFIQKMVVELRSYDFVGFSIDKWFTDPEGPGFLKTTTGFGHYFDLPVGAAPKPVSQAMVRAFRTSIIDAAVSDKQSQWDPPPTWHQEMLDAFSCSEVNAALTDDLQLKVDVGLQKHFLRVVLPVYVELASASSNAVPLLAAVVRLLVDLVRAAHTRVQEADDREELWALGMALLRMVSNDGTEFDSDWLEVEGEEAGMREWARRDLETAVQGIAVEVEVNVGMEEVVGVVKTWEDELRGDEAERKGWEELALVFA